MFETWIAKHRERRYLKSLTRFPYLKEGFISVIKYKENRKMLKDLGYELVYFPDMGIDVYVARKVHELEE